MTTPAPPYARILFAGPDLAQGSFAEVFRQRLAALRGDGALADIVDTGDGHEPLWQRVADAERPLLVVDLEPQGGSAHLDWVRSRLAQFVEPDQLFVVGAGLVDGQDVEAVCSLIERLDAHLPCVGVAAIPEHHAWSKIPAHDQRLLLCNGPRCTRRGALDLWKTLRQRLKAAGRLECAAGVHITRTQCQFPCDLGPTASLYPAGEWYRLRDEAEVIRLVDERLVAGRAVPELRIDQD